MGAEPQILEHDIRDRARRQVDVAEDLSWALFAYSGAAAAAGQSYTGAVLCTRDGRWPAPAAEPRVNAALRLAGIVRAHCSPIRFCLGMRV